MQYRRLFSHHSRSFHWQINVLVTIVAIWGAGIILTAFFLCIPMEANWNQMIPESEKTCIPIIPFYYGLQIPNIVTDLLIIVIPIREVLRLQLNKRLKTGAITMFALGIVTLIFDIIRLIALLEMTDGAQEADLTCKPNAITKPSPLKPLLTSLPNRLHRRRCSLDHHRAHRRHRRSLHPQRPHPLPPQPQLPPLHGQQHHLGQRIFRARAQVFSHTGLGSGDC